MQQSPILSKSYHQGSGVLIFCADFWELSHLARDLSEAEKKITVVKSQTTSKAIYGVLNSPKNERWINFI